MRHRIDDTSYTTIPIFTPLLKRWGRKHRKHRKK
jgi:hypothetical protein